MHLNDDMDETLLGASNSLLDTDIGIATEIYYRLSVELSSIVIVGRICVDQRDSIRPIIVHLHP